MKISIGVLSCDVFAQYNYIISFDDFFFFNRWFIVERIEEDWMFYVWCSENLAAADAGAVVLGRARYVCKTLWDRIFDGVVKVNDRRTHLLY